MHIGEKIREVIALRHYTMRKLADEIVNTLASISNVLKYNFFKHYPVAETDAITTPENDELAQLKARLEGTTKELEASKLDLLMQQKENGYLKQINDLLQKKK